MEYYKIGDDPIIKNAMCIIMIISFILVFRKMRKESFWSKCLIASFLCGL